MTTEINIEDYYPGYNDADYSVVREQSATYSGTVATALTLSGTNSTAGLTLSGTQTIGINMSGSYATAAIVIGVTGTPITLAAVDDHIIDIYATSGSTNASTSVRPIYMKCTMTGAAGVGGRAEFHMYTNVALGGWANAIKGYTEFGASGRVTGLGSAIVGEIALSAGTTPGSYAALEAEIVLPANAVTGLSTSFLYCNISGASAATFDTYGFLFEVGEGITMASGKFFQENTASAASHALKCKVDGSTYYVMLTNTGA